MYKITEKYLSDLTRDYSRSLVGRLCKQIESLQKDLDENSPEFKYLNHAKNLHREMIYETFRDLKNQVKAFDSGIKLRKFNITPSTNSKELS